MEEMENLTPGAGEQNEPALASDIDINETEVTADAPVEAPEAADRQISPDWRFGEDAAKVDRAPTGAGNGKRFFGVFGAVVALCMALLIVTLLLGDAGIKIYRTLAHERTVFVKEYDNGESGLLAPEEAADLIKKSTVTVSIRTKTGTGIGSGFIYTADGYICTNHHVVEDAVTVQVVLPGGEAVDATVVGTDALSDLAVLKINKTGLVPVKLGKSAAALVGESVVAVGTPAKLDYAGTATFGKLSATNRVVALTENNVVTKKMTLLQTDASVNPGNSGGPLANMYGEVIGVVVMKVSYFGGTVFDGIGFAIPIDGAKTVIDAIIKDGKFEGQNPVATGRTLLGIGGVSIEGGYWYSDLSAQTVTRSEVEQEGYTYIPFDGACVTGLNNANVTGKLQVGDIIVKIDNLNMYSIYDIIDHVNRYGAGDTVRVTVMRPAGADYTSCEELTFDITLLAEDLK